MAIPVPHTWVAGTDNAISANMQTLTDSCLFMLGSTTSTGARKPLAVLTQTVAQTIVTSTATAITFTTETVDYDNGHSTTVNTSRYTANTAGWYDVSGVVCWTGNATGVRISFLAVNGTAVLGSGAGAVASANVLAVPTPELPIFLNVTDFVEVWGWQTSGGNLATTVGDARGQQSGLSVEWRSN